MRSRLINTYAIRDQISHNNTLIHLESSDAIFYEGMFVGGGGGGGGGEEKHKQGP